MAKQSGTSYEKKSEDGGKEETKDTSTPSREAAPKSSPMEAAVSDAQKVPDADGMTTEGTVDVIRGVESSLPKPKEPSPLGPSALPAPFKLPTDVKFKTSFTSILDYNVSGILKNAWFKLKMSIGDITTKEKFDVAVNELALELLKHYDGVYTTFNSEIDPLHRTGKLTVPSQSGFDYIKYSQVLDNGAYERFTRPISEYHLPDRKILTEEHNYFGLQFERDLTKLCHRENQRYLVELDQRHNAFRDMQDRFFYLAPLDPEVDLRFKKCWFDPRMLTFDYYFQENHFLLGELFAMWQTVVDQNLMVATSDLNQVSSRLATAVRLQRGQSSKWAAVPGSVSVDKALNAIKSLCIVKMAGSRLKLATRFPVRQWDPVLLLECLSWKLFVSSYDITSETLISIDNYLNEWFIPRTRGFKPALHSRVPINDADHVITNYLSISLNNGAVNPVYVDFLRSSGNGAGWNTRSNQYVPFTQASRQFSNRNEMFMPFGGAELPDWGYDFNQLTSFNTMVDDLSLGMIAFPGDPDRGSSTAFMSVLLEIQSMSSRISEFAYYLNLALRKMSISNIAIPSFIEGDISKKNYEIILPTASFFSVPFTIKPETLTLRDNGMMFRQLGEQMHRAANVTTEMYYYIADTYRSPVYTKADRLDKLVAMTGSNPFTSMLTKQFGAKPNSHDIHWPPRSMIEYDSCVFKVKLDAAVKVIHENSNLFGYAPHFYYSSAAEFSTAADGVWREYFYLAPNQSPARTIDWAELIDLMEYEKMTPLIREARRKGEVIKFNIPIRIDLVEGSPIDNKLLTPIDYLQSGREKRGDRIVGTTVLKSLPIYYRLEEDFFKKNANKHMVDSDPEWLVDVIPVSLRSDTVHPQSLHDFVQVYNEGWEVVEVENFVLFIARND